MNPSTSASPVTAISPADSVTAHAHFSACLRFETDCWDVHHTLTSGPVDFVLLDVRSPQAFASAHINGAVNLPHRMITAEAMARWANDTVFVVYCAGPHCNGAHRAAVRISELNRPVKLMIGGVAGWLDEGFSLVSGEAALR